MEREYADHVEALRAGSPELAMEVASFRSIEHVLQWMQRRGLTRAAVDLVGMDELHRRHHEACGRELAVAVDGLPQHRRREALAQP
jgi:hypothetical protein